MEDDDLLVPLAALEHWSFCRRQCGLIHLEGLWAENVRTVEGKQLHEKVDLPGMEQRPGIRLARALTLKSERHGLVGKADLVTFYDDPLYPVMGRPFPVEYKRSARNTFRHAELQLCAQGLCLEEMLGVRVPAGALYFGASRRRREVAFDDLLRLETLEATRQILAMLREGRTPPPEPGSKCEQCSLKDLCLPGLPGPDAQAAYLRGLR
jgi:CRISPR-associated exonuclease Cas4